jgi:NTP pyrophosphatase (non-canonical NTP hydrolase)
MLDEKQRETLLIMQEECAEVIQAVSKIFRFGPENFKPGKPLTNTEHLETELGDLLCMIEILYDQGMIKAEAIEQAMQNKREKLKIYSRIYHES